MRINTHVPTGTYTIVPTLIVWKGNTISRDLAVEWITISGELLQRSCDFDGTAGKSVKIPGLEIGSSWLFMHTADYEYYHILEIPEMPLRQVLHGEIYPFFKDRDLDIYRTIPINSVLHLSYFSGEIGSVLTDHLSNYPPSC